MAISRHLVASADSIRLLLHIRHQAATLKPLVPGTMTMVLDTIDLVVVWSLAMLGVCMLQEDWVGPQMQPWLQCTITLSSH